MNLSAAEQLDHLGLEGGIEEDEEDGVDEAVEETEVEAPGAEPGFPLDAEVDADGPPAQEEGGGEGDHRDGDLVSLRLLGALLVQLPDDQAVGDDDDDGGDDEDGDGHGPDPVGAEEGERTRFEVGHIGIVPGQSCKMSRILEIYLRKKW